ncbi:MAG TPA: UbiH/UbiF/VisC/COQ6 family ubiquinone biosynthesis hydroxylase [Parvularculaceae bacterium]|nr:UbiH/UbiF/VisC/COQ6 family ubiquinone biosynthesis hydroxylase [Parvularculaceae bacterium]
MSEVFDRDAIIVGGGLAGGLAALALARAGLNVAVIDAQDPAAMRSDAFDGRTTALAYACARLFRRLGLWPAIEAGAEPIRDILVTDGRAKSGLRDGAVSPFHLHFDSRELEAGEPLGYIVENSALRNAIFDAIAARPEIDLRAPAKVASVERTAAGAAALLGNGERLSAPLIIAADGKNSRLRAEAGIKVNHWTYPQTGIVATVAHERPHMGVAYEFFLPAGPFAILPMTEKRSNLVWTERKDAAAAYLALDDAAFTREIVNRFGDFLGAVSLAGPRWSYPLSFHLSQSFIASRLALIGDAAHAVHPIAGQGFNLGVKDIAALADILEEASGLGLDLGSESVLSGYQRWRRFDSASLALGMDSLVRLFSNDFGPLRVARDIGMGAVGRIPPLRRFFMRQAGADLGKLPPLMQAER